MTSRTQSTVRIILPREKWEEMHHALCNSVTPPAKRVRNRLREFLDGEKIELSGVDGVEMWIERTAGTWWAIIDYIADQNTEIEQVLRGLLADAALC